MGCSKSSSRREVQTNRGLLVYFLVSQETRKISNKQPKCTFKSTSKRKTSKDQNYKEGNNKDESRNKLNRDKK